jgi:hypothetical protein
LQFGAHVSLEAHWQALPQQQSDPQAQFSSREGHAQLWLQVQEVVLNSVLIGVSSGLNGCDDR